MCSRTLKVVLVGDGGTGKTSFVSRVSTESFSEEYTATLGYEVTHSKVQTSRGDIKVAFWDTAGQEKVGPMRDQYYEQADAAIMFFDVTSRITYKNIPSWHRDLTRVCETDIPMVLFANKIDITDRKVKTKSIHYHNKCTNVMLIEGSVKNNLNLKESLEHLLRRVLDDDNIDVQPLDTLVQAMGAVGIADHQFEDDKAFSRDEVINDWKNLFQ